MFLIELAFQGVRGLPPTVRLPLQAGLHVLRVQEPELRTLVLDAVYHTLYPDPSRSRALESLASPDAAESRVAVTYYGRDKATYRMIRDIVGGGIKLYRFEPDREKYKLLTASATEAAQFVRVQEGLPDDVIFERLFTYDPKILPSTNGPTRSGAPSVSQPPAPSAPGMPASPSLTASLGRAHSGVAVPRVQSALAESEHEHLSQVEDPGVSEAQRRAEFERLKANYDRVAKAEVAQAEIDQLASRRFELADEVEAVTRRRLEVERVRADMASFGDLSEMPEGFAERLASYEERQSRYEAEQERHRQDMLRLEKELDEIWVEPLAKDRYFLLPVALSVLALTGAWALARPWIALLNIPAVLVAGGAALRWIGEREKHFRASVRLRAARDREERLDKQHQLDTSVTRRMMERLGVDGPAAVLERVRDYENRRNRLQRLEAEIAQHSSNGRIREAERELHAIESRTQQLEAVVLAAAGATSSAAGLRRQLLALARELGEDLPELQQSLPPQAVRRPPDSQDLIRGGFDDLNRPAPAGYDSDSIDLGLRPTGETLQPKLRRAPGRSSSVVGKPIAPPPGTNDLPVYASSDLPTPTGIPAPSVASRPPRPTSTPSRVPIPREVSDLAADLATEFTQDTMAQSEFSSFVSAADPLGSSVDLHATPPVKDADGMFDFGGSYIGVDVEPDDAHDDDDEGYGSGYGSGGSPKGSGGGQKASGYSHSGSDQPRWLCVGVGGFGGPPSGPGAYGEGGARPDRSLDLFEAARDLMTMEVDELAKRIQPRLGQYLGALTSGMYEAARIGARGQVSVGKGDRFVAYPDLPASEVDKVDVALRLCLAEAVLRRVRVPILIHDPCVELPDAARALYRQMLGYLGRASQVLVVTPHDDIEGVVLSLTQR